ncbi:MAG: response regulator [Nitrospirota bacterium]|nr:response regulator [Nitrospirota bacterium]
MARILIIDDEELARYAVRKILTGAGHDVTEAENGSNGLELQRKTPFDLVITDIVMPEKEGIETIMDLKKEFPDTPIVAISGGGRLGPTDYLNMSSQLGARQTLAKPFSRDDLLSAVDTCLAAA